MNRKLFVLPIVCAAFAVTPAITIAQNDNKNPRNTVLEYDWTDANGMDFVKQLLPVPRHGGVGEWIPALIDPKDDKSWNKRYTQINGKDANPIWNIDSTGITFGFTDDLNNVVTAAASNKYWDKFYMIRGNRSMGTYAIEANSTSSFVENCYGFATGKEYVVNQTGFSVITQDEYQVFQTAFCKNGCMMKLSLEDHCFLMGPCCNCPLPTKRDTINTTREKNQSSGVYAGTWDCTKGGFLELFGTMYCKK